MKAEDWFKRMHDAVDGKTEDGERTEETPASKISRSRNKPLRVEKPKPPDLDYLREWEQKHNK